MKNFKISLQIAIRAGGLLFAARIVLLLLTAVSAYIPIFVWREVINHIQDGGVGTLFDIIGLIVVYGILLFVNKLILVADKIVEFHYEDRITKYLDDLLVNQVADAKISLFDDAKLGNALSNSFRVLFSFRMITTTCFILLKNVVLLGIAFVLLTSLNWLLIFPVVLFTLPTIILNNKINKNEYELGKHESEYTRVEEYINDLFYGESRKEILIFDICDLLMTKKRNAWQKFYKYKKGHHTKNILFDLTSGVFVAIIEAIIYLYSVGKILAKKLLIGDMVYYVQVIAQFTSALSELMDNISYFRIQAQQIGDVFSFTEMSLEKEETGSVMIDRIDTIEFKNVTFKYPSNEKVVLDDCSFVIDAREKNAFVGLNGSGKTTIVSLILKLYTPDSGKIMINGIDLNNLDLINYRKKLSIMFQNATRYSMTALENIILSDIYSPVTDERVQFACKMSQTDDIIKEWDKGLDTSLTNRFDSEGKELSGGQWQRFSLARAFYRTTDLVLLDEPSASLDPLAEYRIFKDFYNLLKNSGAIMISHRLSNITMADKIFVLSKGKIVEQGTHDMLLKRKGIYSELYTIQASKYDDIYQ